MTHVLRTNINQKRSDVKNLNKQIASESLKCITTILKSENKITNAQA